MKGNLTCGIAFNFHDSSVSFAEGNRIILVLEGERIFRKKKMSCTAKEMETLIQKGLDIIRKTPDDVSLWALETLRNPWISSEDSFPNPPVWKDIEFLGKKRKSLIVNHHLAHASAYFFSPFNDAVVISCDGGGDRGERFAVYRGKDLELKKEAIGFKDYITAKPYDLISTYLYGLPMCEGKLMALAAYGEPKDKYLSILQELIPALNKIFYNESNTLLNHCFPGLKAKASSSNKEACDLAASIQHLFVEHRLRDIDRISKRYVKPNLILVGGASLNLEVNTEVWKRKLSESDPYIPPCCDDTGQSIGALSYLIKEVYGKRPEVQLPYLGCGSANIQFSKKDIDVLVDDLLEGKVILVHNSRAEIGPRALGNRSFIARPDNIALKQRLSVEIKKREDYRPVAPIVIDERVNDYFMGPKSSPFMLYQYEVDAAKKNLINGVIHYNGTARAQTIAEESNPFIYHLIRKFGDRTGTYVLINTSLNLKGEPLANTLKDTLSISKKIFHGNRIVVYNGRIMK